MGRKWEGGILGCAAGVGRGLSRWEAPLPKVHHTGLCPGASPTAPVPAGLSREVTSLLAQRSQDPTRHESQDAGPRQDIRRKLCGS